MAVMLKVCYICGGQADEEGFGIVIATGRYKIRFCHPCANRFIKELGVSAWAG